MAEHDALKALSQALNGQIAQLEQEEARRRNASMRVRDGGKEEDLTTVLFTLRVLVGAIDSIVK